MNLNIALALSVIDRMSGPARAALATTRDGVKGVALAQVEADRVAASQAMISAWRARRQAVSEANAAFATTQTRLAQLAATNGKGTAEWNRLVQAARNAKTAQTEEAQALARLRQEMQGAGIDTSKLATAQARLAQEAAQASSRVAAAQAKAARQQDREDRRGQMAANGAAMQGLAAQALAVATTGGPLGLAAKAAMDFQDSFADLNKVANFDPSQVKTMSAALLDMQTHIPMAATGLADIMAAAKMSNVANDDLIPFTETAAKMGVAFDMSGKEAGATMASWRSAMGLTIERTFALGDAVNYLSNNGMNASAVAISQVIQRNGALAQTAGLAEQKTAALAAAFLSAGTAPEMAATGMKNFLGALTDGLKATPNQVEAWNFLGFDPEQLSKDMQADAEGTVMKVMDRLAAAYNDPAVRAKVPALTSILFGEESKGAIMPLLTNIDMLKKGFGLVGDASAYAGSMQQEYEARSKTTSNAIALMKNSANSLAVAMGTQLLPAISATANAAAWLMGGAAGLAQEFPIVSSVVMYAGVAVTTLMGAVLLTRLATIAWSQTSLAAASAIAFLRGAAVVTSAVMGGLRNAFTVAAIAARGLGLAMMANPIGLVIAGIAAAAALIYVYWEPISGFFSGLWEKVKAPAVAAWDYVKNLLAWTPLGVVIANWQPISDFFGGLWDGITSKAAAAWNWIKDKIVGPLSTLKETFGGAWAAIFGGDDTPSMGPAAQAAMQSTGNAMPLPPSLSDISANDNFAAGNDNARGGSSTSSVVPMQRASGGDSYSFQITVSLNGVGMKDVEDKVRKGVEDALRQAMSASRSDSRAVNYDPAD